MFAVLFILKLEISHKIVLGIGIVNGDSKPTPNQTQPGESWQGFRSAHVEMYWRGMRGAKNVQAGGSIGSIRGSGICRHVP